MHVPSLIASQIRRRNAAVTCAAVSLMLAGCSGTSTSTPSTVIPSTALAQFTRAPGSFYAQYTGPQRPALDVIAASSAYSASAATFTISATMNGPIAAGAPNYYVFGINRGGATNAPFPGEPNVIFNSVVSVTVAADGSATGVVNLIPGSTPLPGSAITISGASLRVIVPAAMLPSTGATPTAYTWNLWPRSGLGGTPAAQIAAFAPENAELPFVAVP